MFFRGFCYTVLLTNLKIGLSLSKSLFDNVIKALSFCHFAPLRKPYEKAPVFAYLCRNGG